MGVNIADNVSKEAWKDIIDLENKINIFKEGKSDEDKFKLFRLTRGVYGQRQLGVQMIRIKLPYGKVTCEQMIKMSDISDKYATGNLHLTTRQDIQYHYVKLDDSPAVWAELEEANCDFKIFIGRNIDDKYPTPEGKGNDEGSSIPMEGHIIKHPNILIIYFSINKETHMRHTQNLNAMGLGA